MKIVHIAPNSPYNIGWGYQENLLPRYQRKLGHEVVLITTNTENSSNGIVTVKTEDTVLPDGVRLIRKEVKNYFHPLLTFTFSRLCLGDLLYKLMPDMIFFHGLVSTNILDAIVYKKKINPSCIIVEDNHHDYYNGRKTNSLIGKLMHSFYILLNRYSQNYVSKVYGVTQWREAYAEDYFGIAPEKTDVLIMGADDEKINFADKPNIRKAIRSKLGIAEKDFLVCSGGKIDNAKNILELMVACSRLPDIKLLLFGSVALENKKEFDDLLERNENIRYIGWIPSETVYDYFLASDLICFPGTHSVMWEQACACKIPCLMKHWEGMEHVNVGGNCEFLDEVTVDSLKSAVEKLVFTEKYYKMKTVAESEATDVFLYSKIAEKSLTY